MVKLNNIIRWQRDNLFNFIDFTNLTLLAGFLISLWLSYSILQMMIGEVIFSILNIGYALLIVLAGALIGSYIRKGSFELLDEAVFFIGLEKFIKFLAVIFLIQIINIEPITGFFNTPLIISFDLTIFRALISTGLYLVWWYVVEKNFARRNILNFIR